MCLPVTVCETSRKTQYGTAAGHLFSLHILTKHDHVTVSAVRLLEDSHWHTEDPGPRRRSAYCPEPPSALPFGDSVTTEASSLVSFCSEHSTSWGGGHPRDALSGTDRSSKPQVMPAVPHRAEGQGNTGPPYHVFWAQKLNSRVSFNPHPLPDTWHLHIFPRQRTWC